MPEIKNLKKAGARILKGLKKKERIIIYADSDLDGIASAIILKEAIKNLGGEIAAVYFPDREKEGYGITQKGLNALKKFAPALFIALDCGVGNFKELKKAKEMGFEAVIIDHHEILDKLPEASIIVDPKQKGDKYPFKELATAGLAFKLAEFLLKDKMRGHLREDLVQLTAMATIADMMPRKEDNEVFITEGINYLETSWRPGIKVLLAYVDGESSLMDKIYKINAYLNIRDEESRLPAAYRLLTASNEEEARELAQFVVEKFKVKKQKIKEIVDEVKMVINSKRNPEPLIFEGSSTWELVLLGVAASRLSKEYNKPVFLYKKGEKESYGSVRCPEGVNSVEAMKKFAKKLNTFGGHPQASGFRIKNKYLDEFKEFLMDYFSEKK